MLQGFDKKWIDIGHHNNVTYTNLDGGTYILKVKATNAQASGRAIQALRNDADINDNRATFY